MKNYLISMFIDNELDLDEKIDFVETVHNDKGFKDEAVELLDQEKLLQASMVSTVPDVQIHIAEKRSFFKSWFIPLGGFATATALAAAIFLLQPARVVSNEEQYRFVIYHPEVEQAEIIGTFTDWAPVPMEKIGTTGYWALTLNLPAGEHRYSYLVENGRQIADPTVPVREKDDFGGENSIINVNVPI